MAEPITTVLACVAGYALASAVQVAAQIHENRQYEKLVNPPKPRDDTLWDMTKPMKPIGERSNGPT